MPKETKLIDQYLPTGMNMGGVYTPRKRTVPTKKMQYGRTDPKDNSNQPTAIANASVGGFGKSAEKDPIDGTSKSFSPPKVTTTLDFDKISGS